MFGINLRHSLAIVAAGLLAAAGSASAATHQSHPTAPSVQDGTSNTIAFGEIVTDNKDPDKVILMADMGGQVSHARPSADGIIAVLIGL